MYKEDKADANRHESQRIPMNEFVSDMIRRQGSEPIMVCCPFHNKKGHFTTFQIDIA